MEKAIAEALYLMAQATGDRNYDKGTVAIWAKLIEVDGLTQQQIMTAAIRCARERKFCKLPTYAEFREYALGTDCLKALAEEQADAVLARIRRGSTDSNYEDSITNYLMHHRWSMQTLCATLEVEQTKWWRKDFVESYLDIKNSSLAINQIDAKSQSERLPSGKNNILAPLNQCLNEAMTEIERKEDTCNEEKENAITRD